MFQYRPVRNYVPRKIDTSNWTFMPLKKSVLSLLLHWQSGTMQCFDLLVKQLKKIET